MIINYSNLITDEFLTLNFDNDNKSNHITTTLSNIE